MEPKIAFFDIETAPILGYTWQLYDTNVIEVVDDPFMMSFAVQWAGQKKIHVKALPDYPGYKKNKKNDKKLVTDLWNVMNEAEVIVAHNGDQYDIRWANARFLVHGLPPVSPFKSFDTLKTARRYFKLPSNKLDSLAHTLGIGRKLPHTGKAMWMGCIAGVERDWQTMRRYNAHDVLLLRGVYDRIKPWAQSHPDMRLIGGPLKECCPTCQSTNTRPTSKLYTLTTIKQRMQCNDCGRHYVGAKTKV